MENAIRMMQEAGVDYSLSNKKRVSTAFEQERIYTHVTADRVSLHAKGWSGNTIGELRIAMESKDSDMIFSIKSDEERAFMLCRDSEYKALFYAYENF